VAVEEVVEVRQGDSRAGRVFGLRVEDGGQVLLVRAFGPLENVTGLAGWPITTIRGLYNISGEIPAKAQ